MEVEKTQTEQEPPSIEETPRPAKLKSIIEQGCSRGQANEETTLEEEFEHIHRVPLVTIPLVAYDVTANFYIGSFNPTVDLCP